MATTSGTIQLNTGPLQIAPLAVYHFPCNTTFHGMATGLGSCPPTMEVDIPLYNPDHIRFVKWTPTTDTSVWQLHYNSLHITQPLTPLNATLQLLDHTYTRLHHRLLQQLNTIRACINTINNASASSVNDVCTYVALTLTLTEPHLQSQNVHKHRLATGLDKSHFNYRYLLLLSSFFLTVQNFCFVVFAFFCCPRTYVAIVIYSGRPVGIVLSKVISFRAYYDFVRHIVIYRDISRFIAIEPDFSWVKVREKQHAINTGY